MNQIYRYPNTPLVFVRNDKCGGTFFSSILMSNGWLEQDFKTIDWSQDQVFGLIMDPYVRHVKGMVEDAIQTGSEIIMLKNFGIRWWASVGWIGPHSMPMSIKYGSKSQDINWIPIDTGDVFSEDVIDSIAFEHDVSIDWSIPVFRNESSPYKKKMYDEFNLLLNSPQKQNLLVNQCQDYELYERACKQYSKSAM